MKSPKTPLVIRWIRPTYTHLQVYNTGDWEYVYVYIYIYTVRTWVLEVACTGSILVVAYTGLASTIHLENQPGKMKNFQNGKGKSWRVCFYEQNKVTPKNEKKVTILPT